jgi:HEAT repeat protein
MAVTSLGFLCGPPIGQMFIQYLKKEKSDFVKEQIIELLGRTKNQKAVPILIEILRNSKYSYTLKSPAAYAIACILKEKSMQLFIDIIKTSKERRL